MDNKTQQLLTVLLALEELYAPKGFWEKIGWGERSFNIKIKTHSGICWAINFLSVDEDWGWDKYEVKDLLYDAYKLLHGKSPNDRTGWWYPEGEIKSRLKLIRFTIKILRNIGYDDFMKGLSTGVK